MSIGSLTKVSGHRKAEQEIDDINQKVAFDLLRDALSAVFGLSELKKEGGFMKGSWKDRATYRDFTACDVPKFTSDLNPIASTRWITAVEGAFRTSECKDKNKVNFATNFLRDSAKICFQKSGWMVEDLDNYHLKELRYSTQCHTLKTLWIISRGDESLILWWGIEYLEICMEHKFSTPKGEGDLHLNAQRVYVMNFIPSSYEHGRLPNECEDYVLEWHIA
ncbi:hypothetical protein Tco_0150740 [Tanacetum coccineum]